MGYCAWAGLNEANQIYPHLQACGIICDHDPACPCYQKIVAAHPTIRKNRDREVL